jgi:2-dehydro-3-deoxygluconokinase
MRLVTLGDAALRLTPPASERLETADTLRVDVTGPECTAAVAAECLGADATWLSRVSETPPGRRLVRELRGHGVDVVAGRTDGRQGVRFFERGATPRADTGVDAVEGTSLGGLTIDELPTDRVEAADAAYVTAATPMISAGLAGATAKFLKTATDAGATTAVGVFGADRWDDPDSARETIEELFPAVDIFLGSAAAVETLFDRDGAAGAVMHALASTHGFETVALGREHAVAAWRDSTVHEFARPDVDAVDATGAVDAFAGAFLAGVADGDAGGALKTATATGALTKTIPGSLPAFTPAEIGAVATDVERP